MAGGGEKAPANSAQPRKASFAHGSVYGRPSERQKQGALTSPSVSSSKDSPQQLVTPVQPLKYADSRSSPCSSGSVGSDSGAAPFDICMSVKKCPVIKFNRSLLEINRDKRRNKELSKDGASFLHLRPGMILLKRFIKPNDQVHGRSSEHQKQGACTFSPSVSSSKDSPQQLVTPVQPPKSADSRSSLCSPGSVGSDSGAAPFDICLSANKSPVIKLNRSLLEINRDKRRDKELSKEGASFLHLRPGMVLLKRFIKPNDQVKIVKVCQQLGVGAGGFYQPGYRDGAKLRLYMMCLGKNWNPGWCSYSDTRPFDGAQPPTIPEQFRKYVQDAIQASHELLKQRLGAANAMKELPLMSPDICLVNFYNSTGRLGLHQDKAESKSSLDKGLPVVSFSVGETTEFLYGDVRDERKVSKIDLESGDVLIFGGESRLIFHGVSNMKPKTAPKWLTDETSLRPGRLNLTFRQY